MKELFYDTEIINLIPSSNCLPNYNYCKGWTDYQGMGISVIGCYASWLNDLDKYKYFILDYNYWDNIWINKHPELDYEYINTLSYLEVTGQIKLFKDLLNNADCIIGFNSLNFDDKLLNANGISIKTNIDLLKEVRLSAKLHNIKGKASYKLSTLADYNLSYSKTSSGELAPILWQNGDYNSVIDYCLNDVKLLKDLYYLYLDNKLINPNNDELLECTLELL